MKGLMLKELYLSKKAVIIGLITYFITFVMFVLVKLSILYGNIGKLSDKTVNIVEKDMYYIMPLSLAFILYVTVMTNNTKSDEISKWRRYTYTLPLSEKQVIGSSYIYNAFGFAAATVINFIVYFIALALYGIKFDYWMLFIILGIGALAFIMLCLNKYFTILLKGNTKKATAILCCIYMGLYFGIAFGFSMYLDHFLESRGYKLDDNGEWPEKATAELNLHLVKIGDTIKNNLWWSVPLILVSLGVLLYFLSVKALKRREK